MSAPPSTQQPLMRSALFHGAHDLRIEHVPPPTFIPPKHIKISNKFCGICGSDLHFYFSEQFAASLKRAHPITGQKLPIAFGHEWSGVVLEKGEGCGSGLVVGDNVAIMPTISDGDCPSCVGGRTNTCSRLGFMGINGIAGGLSEVAIVPEELVFPLPKGVECDIGALIEPLAVAWHGVSLAEDVSPSTTCLILGAGPVGCAVLLCLRAKGVTNIAISEPSAERRNFTSRIGASHTYDPISSDSATAAKQDLGRPDGVDIVFDCAGVGPTLNTAVAAIKSRGTIVNLAVPTTPTSVFLLPMTLKEAVLRGSIAYTRSDFETVLKAVGDGSLDARALITKRVKLEDVVEQGFVALHQKDNAECKILVDLSL